jgi:rhodanese-related sulfurtransferase
MFNFFSGPDVDEVDSEELQKKISGEKDLLILDVRTRSQFRKYSINPGSGEIFNYSSRKLLGGLPEDVDEELSNQEIVVVCYEGNASQAVAAKLNKNLDNPVKSLKNGMTGWRKN